jgi:hypothetical protein
MAASRFLMQWHEPLTLSLPNWYAETRGPIRVCIETIKVQIPDLTFKEAIEVLQVVGVGRECVRRTTPGAQVAEEVADDRNRHPFVIAQGKLISAL